MKIAQKNTLIREMDQIHLSLSNIKEILLKISDTNPIDKSLLERLHKAQLLHTDMEMWTLASLYRMRRELNLPYELIKASYTEKESQCLDS